MINPRFNFMKMSKPIIGTAKNVRINIFISIMELLPTTLNVKTVAVLKQDSVFRPLSQSFGLACNFLTPCESIQRIGVLN